MKLQRPWYVAQWARADHICSLRAFPVVTPIRPSAVQVFCLAKFLFDHLVGEREQRRRMEMPSVLAVCRNAFGDFFDERGCHLVIALPP
jgi:hypothetical protein